MPVPEGSGSGESPSLFASLRSFWGVLIAILYTRLDLVTAELEDEAVRAVKLLVSGLIALIAFATAFFFVNFWIIAAFWSGPYRLLAIGIVLGVYLLIGMIAALAARNLIATRPKFLSQTIAELRKDAEGLSKAIAPKKEDS